MTAWRISAVGGALHLEGCCVFKLYPCTPAWLLGHFQCGLNYLRYTFSTLYYEIGVICLLVLLVTGIGGYRKIPMRLLIPAFNHEERVVRWFNNNKKKKKQNSSKRGSVFTTISTSRYQTSLSLITEQKKSTRLRKWF